MVFGLLTVCGCGPGGGRLEPAWGRRGLQPGDFIRPRAIAIDAREGHDLVYVVDVHARIQVFTREGTYLRGWTTPTILNGRPAGLGIGRDGNLLVADSHYSQVLVYSPQGELRRRIAGDTGVGPGPFAYVSDVVQDADGSYYIAEFGHNDRIQKFSPDGRYLTHWGSHGSRPGEFTRPRALGLGLDGLLYVADAGNHRIQAFDLEGKLVACWGEHGSAAGQLSYPYDLAFAKNGDVFVLEHGNHRVQRFTPAGHSKGCWGGPGREAGLLTNPWGLAADSRGRVYIVDTDNHRIQWIE